MQRNDEKSLFTSVGFPSIQFATAVKPLSGCSEDSRNFFTHGSNMVFHTMSKSKCTRWAVSRSRSVHLVSQGMAVWLKYGRNGRHGRHFRPSFYDSPKFRASWVNLRNQQNLRCRSCRSCNLIHCISFRNGCKALLFAAKTIAASHGILEAAGCRVWLKSACWRMSSLAI